MHHSSKKSEFHFFFFPYFSSSACLTMAEKSPPVRLSASRWMRSASLTGRVIVLHLFSLLRWLGIKGELHLVSLCVNEKARVRKGVSFRALRDEVAR